MTENASTPVNAIVPPLVVTGVGEPEPQAQQTSINASVRFIDFTLARRHRVGAISPSQARRVSLPHLDVVDGGIIRLIVEDVDPSGRHVAPDAEKTGLGLGSWSAGELVLSDRLALRVIGADVPTAREKKPRQLEADAAVTGRRKNQVQAPRHSHDVQVQTCFL